jgi:hypothetical protein
VLQEALPDVILFEHLNFRRDVNKRG